MKKQITLTLDSDILKRVDKIRGPVKRSTWIEMAVSAFLKQKEKEAGLA
jgi:metal-responsive CopG/Arc/MetJ family transcriptional regulator